MNMANFFTICSWNITKSQIFQFNFSTSPREKNNDNNHLMLIKDRGDNIEGFFQFHAINSGQ